MIHHDTAEAAAVMAQTFTLAQSSGQLARLMPEVLPMLAIGFVVAMREMALHCIDQELP